MTYGFDYKGNQLSSPSIFNIKGFKVYNFFKNQFKDL
jgi:hypothetical protein